jgi:hypothetical protein
VDIFFARATDPTWKIVIPLVKCDNKVDSYSPIAHRNKRIRLIILSEILLETPAQVK